MKRIIIIIIVLIGFTYNTASAQMKFGYVNAAEILYLMPEMKNVNHVLDSFEQSLGVLYQKDMEDYQALLKKKDDAIKEGKSESVLNLIQDEITAKEQYLGKAQTVYQEEMVEKQNKLLTPLNEKILKAIKDVAAEKSLNYIFDISKGALLFWDEKDDVNKDVRKKLGIAEDAKLPTNGGK